MGTSDLAFLGAVMIIKHSKGNRQDVLWAHRDVCIHSAIYDMPDYLQRI